MILKLKKRLQVFTQQALAETTGARSPCILYGCAAVRHLKLPINSKKIKQIIQLVLGRAFFFYVKIALRVSVKVLGSDVNGLVVALRYKAECWIAQVREFYKKYDTIPAMPRDVLLILATS